MDKELLLNFHRILVLVRLDIRCVTNISILQLLLKRLRGEIDSELMCRKIILLDERYSTVLLQVKCANKESIQQIEKFGPMFEKALEEMLNAMDKRNYEYAYDIVDVFEVLPNILLDEKKKSLKQYWKIYIKSLEKKWDKKVFFEFEELFKVRSFISCFTKERRLK